MPEPLELVSGRDIELIAVGIASLFGSVWFGFQGQSINWIPLITFVSLASVSLILAWWDVRSRGG